MKFLVLGDLHGKKPRVSPRRFEAIISPGDFAANLTRKYKFKAIRESKKNPEKEIDWRDYPGQKKAKELEKKEDQSGLEVMNHLESFNKKIYFVPGNYEPPKKELSKILKKYKNFINCHLKLIDIGDYQIIGYGYNSFPELPQTDIDKKIYKTNLPKQKKEYKKNKAILNKLFKKATKPIIFIVHNPPYNTPIDIVLWPGSPRHGEHLGSILARELIDKFQPLVCCCGHMHEHFMSYNLNKTLCINPGDKIKKPVFLELTTKSANSTIPKSQ